jgi:Flp pilus assembly pilin Flp
MRAPRLIARLFRDDAGQDIIEYALLSALVGVVGILIWQNIGVGIRDAYTGWDTGVQTLSTCTPDPVAFGGGCS